VALQGNIGLVTRPGQPEKRAATLTSLDGEANQVATTEQAGGKSMTPRYRNAVIAVLIIAGLAIGTAPDRSAMAR
jgi:hypothetical protein